MAIRNIIEIGHRVLKLKNKRIVDFKSAKLKKLVKDLIDTMKHVDLIGIAAPQIAENYQVFITQPRKTQARKFGKDDKLRVYINPKIIFTSKAKSVIYEGCGCVSKGSIFGPVERPKEIEVEAFNLNGERFSLRCDGILARVILHEYDHLQGIEFLEKISDYSKLLSINFYVKNIRNSKEQQKSSKITKIEYKKF